jgi:hypothetical protein
MNRLSGPKRAIQKSYNLFDVKKKKKENLKKSYTMLNCQRDNLLKRNGPIYIFQKPSIKCLSISTKVRIDRKIKGKNNI